MTESIQTPDLHYLRAALGWLELGNLREAAAELELVAPALANHPDVLEMRWQIEARAKRWETCLKLAEAIIKRAPASAIGWIHRSYALHEMQRTAEARDELKPVAGRFPEELTIPYNLACYECKLGNLTQAREWLGKVFSSGQQAEWKATAMADEDLKPLWAVISKL
jgi:predicted Zn-dependent protease